MVQHAPDAPPRSGVHTCTWHCCALRAQSILGLRRPGGLRIIWVADSRRRAVLAGWAGSWRFGANNGLALLDRSLRAPLLGRRGDDWPSREAVISRRRS